ncbi:autotransporter-associated beta strand protein, partial [Methylobacterium sp. BE186]|uniref:autotransporter-associated beta strand repeat-containing protein n=1 Tax=Methylobacterium sp. BE186 TaxID=2817715 RepID=UPI0028582D35
MHGPTVLHLASSPGLVRERLARLLVLAVEAPASLLARLIETRRARTAKVRPAARVGRRRSWRAAAAKVVAALQPKGLPAGSMLVLASLAAPLGMGAASPVNAQTWIGAGAPADYNNNANWTTNAAPTGAGSSAIFSSTGVGAVDVTAAISPSAWTFNADAQSYSISGANVDFGGTGITNSATAGTISIGNNIGGTGGVEQNGAGTLTLSGVNTYTGATTISGGTLALSGAGTIAQSSGVAVAGTFDISGVTPAGTSVTTLSGAGGVNLGGKTLTITSGSTTYAGNATGTGGGLTLAGGGLTLTGANTYTGLTTVAGGTTLQIGGGGATGAIVGNAAVAGTLAFNRNNALTYAGDVSGTGLITQTGAGTTTLSGALTNGGVQVASGGVIISGSLNTAGTGFNSSNPAALVDRGGTSIGVSGAVTATSSAGDVDGVQLNGGTLTLDASGSVNAKTSGVFARAGGTIANAGAITGGGDGVFFSRPGTAQSLTVTGGGSITGTAGSGILAETGSGTITLGTTAAGGALGTVAGAPFGIRANTDNGGSVSIVAGGPVTSTTGAAISVTTSGAGSAAVTLQDNVSVRGATAGGANHGAGVLLTANGSGAATLTAGNNVTVRGDQPAAASITNGGDATQTFGNTAVLTGTSGVVVDQQSAAGIGLATIAIGTGGTVTAAGIDPTDPYQGNALFAGNQGTGATSITTGAGTVVTGSNGAFLAQTNGANANGATVSLGGATTGNGAITTQFPNSPTYTAAFAAAGIATQGLGVGASNAGSGLLTITGAGAVSGTAGGIVALASGTGGITVAGAGATTSANGIGIDARVTGAGAGDIFVTRSGQVTSGTIGINASTAGTGAVTINAGPVTTTNGSGIVATAPSGVMTISTNGNVTAGGAGNAGLFLTGPNTANSVTVATGNIIEGAIGLRIAGTLAGITTLTNNGTIRTSVANGNALQIDSGRLRIADSGASAPETYTGRLAIGSNSTLEINRSKFLTFSAANGNVITGDTTAQLLKLGAGTLTIASANVGSAQFSGTTNVTGGTLLVDGTFGNPVAEPLAVPPVVANSSVINVGLGNGTPNSGTLGGNGVIAGTVNLIGGGTLSAGGIAPTGPVPSAALGTSPTAVAGTLTINGNLNVTSAGGPNANTVFNLAQAGFVGGANDLIQVGGALNVAAGTLTLTNATGTGAAGAGLYRLFTVGSGGTTAANYTIDGNGSAARLIYGPGSVDVRIGGAAGGGRFTQFWDGTDLSGTGAGAQGGDGTWVGNNATTGNTNWGDARNAGNINDVWQGGYGIFVANTSGVNAPGGTVTVNGSLGPLNFERLDFEQTGYVLAPAAGGTLVLTGDTGIGAFGLTAPAAGPTTVLSSVNVIGAGDTTQINVPLASPAGVQTGLLKVGAGTLQLGGINTYTGDTRIAAGTLQVVSGDAIRDFATGVATGRVLIDNNATARLLVSSAETIGSLESVAQPTAASLAGAANAATANAQGLVTLGAALTTGARTTDTVYAGQFAGAGTLNKVGASTFTLTGSNTATNNYTGTVNVNAGVLRVDGRFGDVVTAAPTATVNVNANGTLQGSGNGGTTFPATSTTTGRIDANVFVNAGGTLAPGNGAGSAGTLTIGGNLSLAAGSASLFDLSGAAGIRNQTSDLVVVNGGLTVNTNAALTLTGAPVSGVYRLFDAATVTGNFAAANIVGPAGTVTYLAANPGGATQVNAQVSLGGQSVQFWDGADLTGVTAGSQAGAGAQGGTGTWNATNTNWTNDGSNTGAAATPGSASGGEVNGPWRNQVGVFGGTAGTVTIQGAVGAEGLQFTTDGYVITGGTLTLTGDSASDPARTFVNVGAGLTATINSALNGAGGLRTRVGSGTLQLGGTGTYTGQTLVDAGTNLVVLNGGSITGSSNLTNNGTTTLQAGSLVTTPTVTNNGTFTSSGTLNATTSLTNTAGATFNLLAGVVTTPTAGNAGSFNHGGGILNAGSFTNAAAATYTQSTPATLNTATTVNSGTFTAGGTSTATTSFTNSGTLIVPAASGDPVFTPTITTPLFTNTGLVQGLLNLRGNTTTQNGANGLIQDGLTIQAAGGGATFTNAGTVGTGGFVFGNSGGTVTVNNNGRFFGNIASAAGSTTTINNSATWTYQGISTLAGTDAIDNAGQFTVTAAGGALNGLERFTNRAGGSVGLNGSLAGPITDFVNDGTVALNGNALTGVGTFTNRASLIMAGGSLGAGTLDNSGTLAASGTLNAATVTNSGRIDLLGNLGGSIGQLDNSGLFNLATSSSVSGIGTLNNAGTLSITQGNANSGTFGVGTFNNLGTGRISLQNGLTTDRLALTGSYAGSAG